MSIGILGLMLVAPLPYWVLGLPWVNSDRLKLAPLIGCALAGLYAEWAMIAGLPVLPAVGAAVVASIAAALYRRRELGGVMTEFVEALPLYWVSVLAASVSPFPILGAWSGDWLIMYQMGDAVVGGRLPETMLTRPPLFGAATAPLWSLQSGLIPYQLMAAVASAAAASVTLRFMRLVHPASSVLLLVPLLLSPLFLHNTAAAWSKLLAGGLVLASTIELLRAQRLAGALLFALAVAVHEGSIIWAPFLLACGYEGGASWRRVVRTALVMGVCGVLVVCPLLFWVIARYGLAAKVAANPSITDAVQLPLAVKTALGTLTAFVGWAPLEVIPRWLSHPDPAAPNVVAKEGFWLITSWVTTLAGTMAGFLLPFAAAWRDLRTAPWVGMPAVRVWPAVGVGIAVVLNAALAGFYSSQGMVQAALVPLALGAYALLVGQLAALGSRGLTTLRRVVWVTVLLGTMPWLLLNSGFSFGLWLSAGFRERMLVASEGDYFHVLEHGLRPLGMEAFPAALCLSAVLLVVTSRFAAAAR